MMAKQPNIDLMQKFLRDRTYLSSFRNYMAFSTDGRPHLVIANPAILATFMGYVKFQLHQQKSGLEVFFRGQTKNYPEIVPSLLRGDDINRINLRSQAYEELKKRSRKLFNNKRFRVETIDNFFQHYGIKSKTLDLVDNLYIAVWFATNSWRQLKDFERLCIHEPSNEEFGWIYFMAVEPPTAGSNFSNPNFTGFCNLREYHSSLSARLHCQHGITYFRQNGGTWDNSNRDFNDRCVAAVKFPNSEEFRMNGTIFTKEFLFPNSTIDNTYKLLQDNEFSDLLMEVETQFALSPGELGQIWIYNF